MTFLARHALTIVALALSVACAIACYFASAGAPLGTMIGGVAFAAIVVPSLVSSLSTTRNALSAACVFAIGTVFVWLVTIPIPIALVASIVLISFIAALAGLARIFPAFIVTILALAWLTWPIWFSEQSHARLWIDAHPIFAINGISPDLGVWTQQHVMYSLTALGQDVPFTLPTSIAWSAALHAFVGLIGFIAALAMSRARRSTAGDAPSDR